VIGCFVVCVELCYLGVAAARSVIGQIGVEINFDLPLVMWVRIVS